MKPEITEQKIKEIVEDYPNQIHCLPRARFDEQLTNHLKKSFGFKVKKKEKKENVKSN